jgi:hypothetical protein
MLWLYSYEFTLGNELMGGVNMSWKILIFYLTISNIYMNFFQSKIFKQDICFLLSVVYDIIQYDMTIIRIQFPWCFECTFLGIPPNVFHHTNLGRDFHKVGEPHNQ